VHSHTNNKQGLQLCSNFTIHQRIKTQMMAPPRGIFIQGVRGDPENLHLRFPGGANAAILGTSL
jgi:hypothetical protein